MKNKILCISLGLCLGAVGAYADERTDSTNSDSASANSMSADSTNADSANSDSTSANSMSADSAKNLDSTSPFAEHFKKNYTYNAQVGAQYSQGYDGNGTSFQSLYAYLGFEGVEFERIRFGLSAMGSVDLGSKVTYYQNMLGANATLYQAFLGYTSDYFDLSAGREAVDLEWVSDYIEGARFAIKVPQADTKINAYWFVRQGTADYNEIVQFDSNKVGHTVIAGIENNSYKPLALEAYFINLQSKQERPSYLGAWVGATLNVGNELVASSTTIKYSYFHPKAQDFLDAHFLDVAEHLEFAVADLHQVNLTLGVMKVFNKKAESGETLPFYEIGNRRPINKGYEYFYGTNALTAYVGLGYGFAENFDIDLIYGNISGFNGNIKNEATTSPINAVDLVITGKYAGAEISAKYRKLINNGKGKKIDDNYFETYIAYNF